MHGDRRLAHLARYATINLEERPAQIGPRMPIAIHAEEFMQKNSCRRFSHEVYHVPLLSFTHDA
jgi:hypothetical protein